MPDAYVLLKLQHEGGSLVASILTVRGGVSHLQRFQSRTVEEAKNRAREAAKLLGVQTFEFDGQPHS